MSVKHPRRSTSACNAMTNPGVLTVSVAIGILALVVPLISPYSKYSGMINRATPYIYPVPVRDDGNMPDIPSHPCDKEGPSLEWLKKL
nr:NADH dehydrogenase [ubiquinone] 1 alpha subcomplex subunit 3 [Pelodiscus sinensis]|eukprot:XP_006120939.1 NADH dehydrogenase [ubiquinone] 1 alpha subcomplex subunit 3 [Pelodiscus sinensis]